MGRVFEEVAPQINCYSASQWTSVSLWWVQTKNIHHRARRNHGDAEYKELIHIADARAKCTPPFVVVARIVGPPEPRSTLISFGKRPRSVIGTFSGNSEFTFPFTVLVSTCAE